MLAARAGREEAWAGASFPAASSRAPSALPHREAMRAEQPGPWEREGLPASWQPPVPDEGRRHASGVCLPGDRWEGSWLCQLFGVTGGGMALPSRLATRRAGIYLKSWNRWPDRRASQVQAPSGSQALPRSGPQFPLPQLPSPLSSCRPPPQATGAVDGASMWPHSADGTGAAAARLGLVGQAVRAEVRAEGGWVLGAGGRGELPRTEVGAEGRGWGHRELPPAQPSRRLGSENALSLSFLMSNRSSLPPPGDG